MLRADRPIRPAGPHDRKALVATLSQAFQTDPAVSWIFPDAVERARRLPRMFGILVDGDLKAGMALMSPLGEVATLWRAPGRAETSRVELVRKALPLIRAFGGALGRALRIAESIDAHHPVGVDYWYLHYAGVQPEAQGRGWGGQAIRAGLARAQSEGRPVYLETATHANVPRYRALGFEVSVEWEVAGGGPHFWSMLRR